MIDIHAHIFPNWDDGPNSMEESQRMLKIAVDDGIEQLVITPHVNSSFCRYHDLDDLVREKENFIRNFASSMPGPQLFYGAEVHLSPELPDLLKHNRELLTLNGSSYVLVEFPVEFIFPHSRDLLYQVMMEGFIPIIVHPERNEEIQRNSKTLLNFIEMGVVCQVDIGSLAGIFGKEAEMTAFHLIRANMVHVIASDAHDSGMRAPRLSHIYRILHELGDERVGLMVKEIPRAILKDEPIPDIGPVGSLETTGGLFARFRRWFS